VAEIASPAHFDRVARLYRPAEYLSFGPFLERCRFFHLPAIAPSRRALLLGDGDGRFLARLLASNSLLQADAVDLSSAMLRLLTARAGRLGADHRLTTTCADARSFQPIRSGYDLVVTHFFLDCLTASETAALLARLRPHLAPGALWLVSEFQIPSGGHIRAFFARTLISALYSAFRLLTGLRVRRIPPWRSLLSQSGFRPCASHTLLGGLLVSELWQLPQATGPSVARSQQEMPYSVASPARRTNIPGIDPGPEPFPGPPPIPHPDPAPGPPPEPDPEPYPGPIPAPQPVTRSAESF
jgi:SAM-dependent methyltransferase